MSARSEGSAGDFTEVRFGGSGGQGVILMGVVLAVAAVQDHYHVVQTQSYGPEARGGYSRSDVIISKREIDYPQLQGVDILVVLSTEAARRYVPMLKDGGCLIYDSEEVTDPPAGGKSRYGLPFTRLAEENTGRPQTANVLTLGAVTELTGVVSVGALRGAVEEMAPEGTSQVNLKALEAGMDAAREELAS